MHRFYSRKTCSICKRSIEFGCGQTCITCGRYICRNHVLVFRYRMSTVLFSLCSYCVYRSGDEDIQIVMENDRYEATRSTV